jgi:hypothetical protein
MLADGEPLIAHTITEVDYYLMASPCPQCGKGPLARPSLDRLPEAGEIVAFEAICNACSARTALRFTCENPLPPGGVESQCISPVDQPSRIIDLCQWLSLFYRLIELAAGGASSVQTRQTGFAAALCLAEALKFYGDNELPPESAFFSPQSLDAFHQHCEKFARQRLRDMQAKLPALPVMAFRLSQDLKPKSKKKWQFWRK